MPATKECVYAVHGFLGNPWEFFFIARHLREMGYDVIKWSHSSVTRPAREYASLLASALESALEEGSYHRVHLIGHSMGGVLVRGALTRLGPVVPPETRGRVVLLATPNLGAPMATSLASHLGQIIPALADLSEREDSYVNTLPEECGWEMGTLWTPHDHLVPPHSASPRWMPATARVSGLHSGILLSPAVAKMVGLFLSTGSFLGRG